MVFHRADLIIKCKKKKREREWWPEWRRDAMLLISLYSRGLSCIRKAVYSSVKCFVNCTLDTKWAVSICEEPWCHKNKLFLNSHARSANGRQCVNKSLSCSSTFFLKSNGVSRGCRRFKVINLEWSQCESRIHAVQNQLCVLLCFRLVPSRNNCPVYAFASCISSRLLRLVSAKCWRTFGEGDEIRRDLAPDFTLCSVQCPAATARTAAAAVVQPRDKNVLRNCEKPLVQHSVLTFGLRGIARRGLLENMRTYRMYQFYFFTAFHCFSFFYIVSIYVCFCHLYQLDLGRIAAF